MNELQECHAIVPSQSGLGHQCQRKVVAEINGKFYCSYHLPEKEQARHEARIEKDKKMFLDYQENQKQHESLIRKEEWELISASVQQIENPYKKPPKDKAYMQTYYDIWESCRQAVMKILEK